MSLHINNARRSLADTSFSFSAPSKVMPLLISSERTVTLLFQGRVFPVATEDLIDRSSLFKHSPMLCRSSSYEVHSPARLEEFESFLDFVRGKNAAILAEANLSSISSLSVEFSVSCLSLSCNSFSMCATLLVVDGRISSLELDLSTMNDAFSTTVYDRRSLFLHILDVAAVPVVARLSVKYPLVPLLTRGYVKMVLIGDSGVWKTALSLSFRSHV
jgi:hypothetical protein